MFVENFPLFIRDFVDKNKKFKNVCEKLLRNVISDAIFKEEITKIEMKEQ
jgi:translation elongation factor EF-Ts